MRRLMLLGRLALADLWHDRKVSLCVCASLVTVIAPLLLLFGLKHGVISHLQHDLLRDPRNLEIQMKGNGKYEPAWLEAWQANPLTGFAIGLTRSLNVEAQLYRTGRHFVESAEIIPTAKGDPLLADMTLEGWRDTSVILSQRAAEKLGVGAGDTLRIRLTRRLDSRPEMGEQTLHVHGILPAATYQRDAALVHPDLLHKLEWFRDGFAVTDLGVDTGRDLGEAARRYARARIYARDVDAVEPLQQALTAQNLETTSRLRDIQNVKAIDRLLSLVFMVIALTAVIGCMASLVGAFLANVERKRRDIAVLRLLGFGNRAVGAYTVWQAVMLTFLAYVAALLLYAVGSGIFNSTLVSVEAMNNVACRLAWQHAVAAGVLALALSVLVSLIGASRAIRIQPAESLREI